MAFCSRYLHDVFISYTHIDNLPDRAGQKGWVECFEERLQTRLLKRFGEPVDVWRDPEVKRAQLYDKVIETAVRGSAVVIPLISNRYLKSEYCEQELAWFEEQALQDHIGITVDDYVRVFPVLLYNIMLDDWPDVCQGMSAFKFFDAADENDFGEPLHPDSYRFDDKMRSLVNELSTVLNRIRERDPDQDQPAVDEDGKFKVFMACSADDLRPMRRQVETELTHQGKTLLGEIPPPYDVDPHAREVRKAQQEADLSVHLLGVSPGEVLDPDSPDRTYPMEQVRLGMEHARSQLIVVPEGLKVEDVEHESYRDLIAELIEQPREEREEGMLSLVRATSKHQILDAILEKQKALEEQAERLRKSSNGAGEVAFLDLHTNDVIYVADLVGYLTSKNVTPMMLPADDSKPKRTMSIFEENLKRATHFIVVFGSVQRSWVDNRLEDAFKLILTNHLYTRIGIYVAPPRKSPQDVRFPRNFDVMLNMEKFNPETLQHMLSGEPAE